MASSSTQPLQSQRWLIWAVLPFAIFVSGLFKVRDLDVWWRVRTGDWIWSHRSIPDIDPFSHTADGAWNCVEPAGNLFLFAFHALFGQIGLSWAGATLALALALCAIALARFVAQEETRLGAIFVAVGLFVSVANFRFGPKPEMFSLCGVALLLLLLHYVEQTRRWKLLFLAPGLVLLWAWLHRGSTVSIPIVGAASLAWALGRDTRKLALLAIAALLLSLVALLLSPGMAEGVSSAASVVSNSAYTKNIGEWQPLTWTAVTSTMPLLIPMVILWVLVAPVQRRVHFGTLVVLGLGFMAFRHVRFAPLWALAMMPEIAWGFSRALHNYRERIDSSVRPRVFLSLLVAAGLAAIALPYLNRPVSTWGPGVTDFRRPAAAATFLAANPPPGRMFNTFNYGSYLLYSLGPAQKVFIDGRNDQLYNPEFFSQAAVTPGNNHVLEQLVTQYDVSYAVLQCTKIVNRSYLWLYHHPQWQLVYLDDNTAVLVKRTSETELYLERHGYQELNPSTALPRLLAPQNDPDYEKLAEEVLRNLNESPNSVRAHYLAAKVHRNAGNKRAYEAELEILRQIAIDRNISFELP